VRGRGGNRLVGGEWVGSVLDLVLLDRDRVHDVDGPCGRVVKEVNETGTVVGRMMGEGARSGVAD